MRSLKSMALLGPITAGLSAFPAIADPSALFGNTLTVTSQLGVTVQVYLNADGSYTELLPNQVLAAGTWVETADPQLCLTQQTPVAMPTSCGPDITQSVGNSWTASGSDGSILSLTIVAGR